LEGVKGVSLDGDNLSKAGEKSIAGLNFKVEIGAVMDTSDFHLSHLSKYGKINSKTYPDGMTRYTFGSFKTLKEAEEFREMLADEEEASKDAFVTVFVFGQEKKVEDIEDEQRKELGIPAREVNSIAVAPVLAGSVGSDQVGVDSEETELASVDQVVESIVVVPVVEAVNEVLVDEVVAEDPVVAVTPGLVSGPCEDGMKDFSWFVGKDLNDKAVYARLIALGGNSCAEGLEFKVQIGAYRFPKNYKWNHLKQFGDPVILNYPDGITRFTQGAFSTIAVAEDLRQKIIASGQKDAWITPFYNGKRMLLEDLFKVNFYGKTIN
jgi:hypothetical protein